MLLSTLDGHLVLPVEKVSKLQEVDKSVLVHVTVVYQVVQDLPADTQLELIAHCLQVFFINRPLAFLVIYGNRYIWKCSKTTACFV